MKRIAAAAAALSLAFSFTARAALVGDSGLANDDSIRFGFVALNTAPRAYSSGGVTAYIFGRKQTALLETDKDYKTDELPRFLDYSLPIRRFAEAQVAKKELRSAGGDLYLSNESFSAKISGRELNSALEKAKSECPQCLAFYFGFAQDTGWGSFDLLPIKNRTGAHSLNQKPVSIQKLEGFDLFNNFIEYLPGAH